MKKKKRVNKKVEVLSMKDALSDIKVVDGTNGSDSKVKRSIRDYIWDYPQFVVKYFKEFVPVSYFLIFLLFGFLLSVFLNSKSFANFLDDSNSESSFTEGSVGAISSFNPLFMSVNYIDRAVQELVFERFVYIDEDGGAIPGIASEWSVSEDNLEYRFKIAEDRYWHDGSEVTAEDVVFTFNTARVLAEDYGFDSVGISLIGVEVLQDGEKVVFKLSEQNPTFFEAISIFVVPRSRFEGEDLGQLAFNIFARYPVGSGQYRVTRTEQNVVYLEDNPYDDTDLDIDKLIFKIYPDRENMEMAFRVGSLDAIGGWDKELLEFSEEYSDLVAYSKVEEYRTKLIFFNLRNENLETAELRVAITKLLDKGKLVEELGAGAVSRKGPFYEDSWVFNNDLDYHSYDPDGAKELLENLGYVKNEDSGYFETDTQEILSYTLSYFESPTNSRLVDILVGLFEQEGLLLKTEALDYNQITQEIIATRDFDWLLYEVETTVDPDQYNLWHSLKTDHPDLNISGYSYERVDILLEDARKTSERKVRKEKYDMFQKYLIADAPVLFLYNPTFNYFVKDYVKGVDISDINYSYERFNNIQDWYID